PGPGHPSDGRARHAVGPPTRRHQTPRRGGVRANQTDRRSGQTIMSTLATASEQALDYTTTFTVGQMPEEVFRAISNVRGWWSEDVEGDADRLGAVFFYSFKDVHRGTFKITDYVPGEKIVWHVLQNNFNFIDDTTEWTGTDIVFEISRTGDISEVRFTHVGLNPAEECYTVCRDAWGFYIRTSLHDLIAKGTGEPNRKVTLSENNPVQK